MKKIQNQQAQNHLLQQNDVVKEFVGMIKKSSLLSSIYSVQCLEETLIDGMEYVFKKLFEWSDKNNTNIFDHINTKSLSVFVCVFGCLAALFPDCGFVGDCAGIEALIGLGIASTIAGAGATIAATQDANSTNRKIASDTNEANIKMQRETNALQKQMFDEQMKQRQSEIEYNSPVNQMSLWRDAGVNPYFALNGMSGAGQISSPVSPDVPSLTAPRAEMGTPVQPVDGFSQLSNIPQQLLYAAQVGKTNAETKGINIDNIRRDAINAARLDEALSAAGKNKADTGLAKANEKRALELLDGDLKIQESTIKQQNAQTGALVAQQELTKTNNAIQQVILKWQPQMSEQTYKNLQAEFEKINAEVGVASSQSALNGAEAAKVMEEKYLTVLQQNGVKIDNKQKEELKPLIVKNAKLLNKKVVAETSKTWEEAKESRQRKRTSKSQELKNKVDATTLQVGPVTLKGWQTDAHGKRLRHYQRYLGN